MGHEILYCVKCRTQLRVSDFEKGGAYRIETQAYCAKCASEAVRSLPADKVRAVLKGISAHGDGPSKRETPASGSRVAQDLPKSTRRLAVPDRRETKIGAIVAGSLASALALAAMFVFLGKGGNESPPLPKEPTSKTPPSTAQAEKPAHLPSVPAERPAATSSAAARDTKREDVAKEALRKAREYQKANPQDFAGQSEIFQQALWVCERTTYAAEIAQELETIKRQELVAYQTELAAFDRDARAAVDREEMKAAFAILRDAESRHPGTQWKLLLGRKTRDLNDQSWKLFDELKEEALTAQQKGDSKGVEKIRQRIARWSFTQFAEALERALGSP